MDVSGDGWGSLLQKSPNEPTEKGGVAIVPSIPGNFPSTLAEDGNHTLEAEKHYRICKMSVNLNPHLPAGARRLSGSSGS